VTGSRPEATEPAVGDSARGGRLAVPAGVPVGASVSARANKVDRRANFSYVTRMAKRPIILLPDPVLRLVAAPVGTVDDELRALADDMLETMYAAPGVGLAAPQVGVSRRVIVMDVSEEDDEKQPYVMINPHLVQVSDELNVHEEGCLSMPDVRTEIERPAKVTVRFLDRAGKQQELAADGLLATCIQHEMDHLDGKLLIDYMSRLRREMVIKRFKKLAKERV
jgi:peptide deformylase